MCFPHKLDINEKSFFKPIDIVNIFNSHFANAGKQTCTKIRTNQNLSCNLKYISNSSGWFDVTEVDVYNIIKNLDSHKSNGEDGISVNTLKKITIL